MGQSARIFLLGVALLLLAACSRTPETGPVEVKWDRDICIHCGMALSDRHYAVEVRGGPKKQVFKFDDIGCAVSWLKKQPWGNDPNMEIWVADFRTGKWLDARAVRYVTGKRTPMGFGYGATSEGDFGSISFDEARKQLLAKDK